MLTDFISDVRKDVTTATEAEITKLIAAEGNGRHDYIRGIIQGLKAADDLIVIRAREYNLAPTAEHIQIADSRVETLRNRRRGL